MSYLYIVILTCTVFLSTVEEQLWLCVAGGLIVMAMTSPSFNTRSGGEE
jgi:hypothetical protein